MAGRITVTKTDKGYTVKSGGRKVSNHLTKAKAIESANLLRAKRASKAKKSVKPNRKYK